MARSLLRGCDPAQLEPFDRADTMAGHERRRQKNPKHYLLLTTSLPADDELDNALSAHLSDYKAWRLIRILSATRRSEKERSISWPQAPCWNGLCRALYSSVAEAGRTPYTVIPNR